MKMKLSPAEIISIIVIFVIGVIWVISLVVDWKEKENRKEAKNVAYSILEAAKLTHMNMDKKETITYTEESYFDGNDRSHGPFLLTLDKYGNSSMEMWVDSKYCVTKKVTDTDFNIDDTKTSEQTCLTKENTVEDLLTNFELVNDTEKTGLDLNNPWATKKYYVGKNPSNYLIFNRSCYRIIGITSNNSIKIIYDGPVSDNDTCTPASDKGVIAELVWDETGSNDWNKPATLKNMIEIWDTDKNVNNVIQTLDVEKLVKPNWYIGKTKENKDLTLKELVALERSAIAKDSYYIGLLNVSDYLKASSNIACNGLNKTTKEECMIDNYLYDGNKTWFFNTTEIPNYQKHAYQLQKDGSIRLKSTTTEGGIRPVLYLKNTVTLTGSGRSSSPYTVS